MHNHNQNNEYKNYSYLPPTRSTASRNAHYQYYDSRLSTRQSRYSNRTSFLNDTSSYFEQLQQQYQPSTTISDLAEPISIFDDLKLPRQRQSTLVPFPSVYIPPNSNRRTSVSDARLATASAMREQLLTDIQHNINEINQELSLLERQPSYQRYTPSRLSHITRQTSISKKPPLPIDYDQLWPDKPKRIYQVVPRIPSEPRSVSQNSISKFTDQTNSLSYIGQYHYGPEIEENEIAENDPENADLKSTVNEISEFNFQDTFTIGEFRREQSPSPHNRALVFVPEYADNNKIELNEITEDIHQTNPINTSTARLSTVNSSHHTGASNKLNLQDFQLLIQTAPEPKITTPLPKTINPAESLDKKEGNLINTILSKPIQHSISPEPIINAKSNADIGMTYFFSDYGNEGEGEEDLISIDPRHFNIQTDTDIIPDDNTSSILIQQTQTNPSSSSQHQQQLTIQNNNEHVNETERKRIDSTTKDIVTSTSTSPSKKILPISINDSMQTQFARNNSNVNTTEQSSGRNSQSITSTDTLQILTNQTEHTHHNESHDNSVLPIPLNSPDVDNIRPSTSRSATPERRKSVSLLDQNVLLTSTDLMSFDNPSLDPFRMNTERGIPSPLLNFQSLSEIQQTDEIKPESQNQNSSRPPSTERLRSVSPLITEVIKANYDDLRLPSISPRHSDGSDANLTSVDREETYRPPITPEHEEKPIFITESQRRSKLSLLVHSPKSKEKKIRNSQIHTSDSSSINNEKKSNQHRHVLFSNANSIAHFQIEENNPLKHWRERINNILEKKVRSTNNKYSHVKSRVNSFANFEYQPRKIMIIPKKKQRTHQQNSTKKKKVQLKQQIPPVKGPKPQMFGRIWCLPDGSPQIFNEYLSWNVESKIKAYSLENLHYKSRRNDIKKSRWHSESRVSELKKMKPHHQIITQAISLPTIPDLDEPDSEAERKIFDINSNSQQLQENTTSSASINIKRSNKLIFDEKLVWVKKSKLTDLIWKNIDYQPKKSTVQIFHQPTHWNRQSQLQITHSLTLDIQAKIKYWSEIDLEQIRKKKGIFSEYPNLNWNDIIPDNLKENFNDQFLEESPANRPKWNSVSKTRSVNSFYNPKLPNANTIRRGWDLELRRKRVHQLPPLKRKRNHAEIPQIEIETPPSNDPLPIDYNYDHAHGRTTSLDYATTSSRRSSRALVPLPRLPDLQLLSESTRSQRPVQQEWYDEFSRSRLTYRTEMERTRNNSVQDSVHQTNSSREPLTLRSSTRNSQHSGVSGTLLDSSIRTNRATELRLSRDMEEHHHHSHDPSQSMPFEIRGFRLEGTQLTVPDNATIRPLSNVNYRASERVKTRRIYPWSGLHPNGSLSRNSSLLPITEFRHPSFETSLVEVPQLIHEE